MDTSATLTDIDRQIIAVAYAQDNDVAYAQDNAEAGGALAKLNAGVASVVVPPGLLSSVERGKSQYADFAPKTAMNLENGDQISDASVQRVATALERAVTIFAGSTAAGQNADRLLARIIVQLTALLAKGELDERLNKRHLAKVELLASAEKTRDSAKNEKRAAFISGIVTIVACVGAMAIAGAYAGLSMKGMSSGLSSSKPANSGLGRGPEPKAVPRVTSNEAEPTAVPRVTSDEPEAVPLGSSTSTSNKQAAKEVEVEVEVNTPPVTNNTAVEGNTPPATNNTATNNTAAGVNTANNTAAADQAASISAMSMSQQRIMIGLMLAQTLNQVGPAAGGVGAMKSTEQSKLDEAASRSITAQSEETKGEGDMSAEMRQSLFEMIKALLEFCKEMNAAKVAKMGSIKG